MHFLVQSRSACERVDIRLIKIIELDISRFAAHKHYWPGVWGTAVNAHASDDIFRMERNMLDEVDLRSILFNTIYFDFSINQRQSKQSQLLIEIRTKCINGFSLHNLALLSLILYLFSQAFFSLENGRWTLIFKFFFTEMVYISRYHFWRAIIIVKTWICIFSFLRQIWFSCDVP